MFSGSSAVYAYKGTLKYCPVQIVPVSWLRAREKTRALFGSSIKFIWYLTDKGRTNKKILTKQINQKAILCYSPDKHNICTFKLNKKNTLTKWFRWDRIVFFFLLLLPDRRFCFPTAFVHVWSSLFFFLGFSDGQKYNDKSASQKAAKATCNKNNEKINIYEFRTVI